MNNRLQRIRRAIILYFINHFLCGTHFFGIKRRLLRVAGVQCGEGTRVVGPIYLGNTIRVSFGDNVWVGTKFSAYGNGEVNIGNNIDIGPDVAIATGSHVISSSSRRAGEGIEYKISIRDGCWIGLRSVVIGNVVIEEGCVIGACSFVNRSTEKNGMYVGIPATRNRSL